MSARDILIGAAYCGFDPERFDPLQSAVSAVDAYRDEVAHELAEKIRNYIGTTDYPDESQRVKDLVAFGRAMANLIDPEVA